MKELDSDLIKEPGGRHVAATVESPLGDLRVHGVCVPWRDAHCRTGRRDRKAWEDHGVFLEELKTVLAAERDDRSLCDLPVVVDGDINQRSGGRYAYGNAEMRKAWEETLRVRSLAPATDETVIDKIAVGPQFETADSRIWSKVISTGEKLSDHDAVSCVIRRSR